MNILFTICARKGSKGLKNKNISNFLEYPLSYYTLSAYDLFSKNNPDINCELAINTDSDELIKQIENTNINFSYIKRTEELAGDNVGKIDVIKDTYLKMQKEYNFIIDLDLTSPLRTIPYIKEALNKLAENKDADLCYSTTNARRTPFFTQVKKLENDFYSVVKNKGFTARQQVPEIFDMNGSIYVYRPQFLCNAKYIFDGKAIILKMKDTAVLDIDNPEDKELMEIIAKYFYQKYTDYNLIYENIKTFVIK